MHFRKHTSSTKMVLIAACNEITNSSILTWRPGEHSPSSLARITLRPFTAYRRSLLSTPNPPSRAQGAASTIFLLPTSFKLLMSISAYVCLTCTSQGHPFDSIIGSIFPLPALSHLAVRESSPRRMRLQRHAAVLGLDPIMARSTKVYRLQWLSNLHGR